MKVNSIRILSVIAVATMIGFSQGGCVTDSTQARVTSNVDAPALPAEEGPSMMESAGRLLNVYVQIRPTGKEIGSAADDVKKTIEGDLAAKRFTISAAAPDITVTLGVNISLFDKSGSYYRYNGKVDVRVERSRDHRLLGEKKFIVSGMRKLDADEAVLDVSQKLGADVTPWVATVCTPVQGELAAMDITINRFLPAAPTSDSRYAKLFVEQANTSPGVVDCRLLRHDYDSRTLVFRVVYSRDLVPEGLVNRLAAIKTLRIRPK